jgi:hypothetical protein
MHGAVAEFMTAEHAATGNDHLELVGLVEMGRVTAPGPFRLSARTLLSNERRSGLEQCSLHIRSHRTGIGQFAGAR